MQFTKSCTVCTVRDADSIKGAWAAKYKNIFSLERCEVLPPRSVRVKENVPVPETTSSRCSTFGVRASR